MRNVSELVKFGEDPDHDPELMTSCPVVVFLVQTRKLVVVETSGYDHSIPRRILDQSGWVPFISVRVDFSL